jgi:hypothetical protein
MRKEITMAYERFLEKEPQPTDDDMLNAIGPELSDAWLGLRRFLVETYQIEPIYQYGGKRYGWNIQHRRGGRPLCEMYPEQGSFTAMVVLGAKEWQAAVDEIDTFGETVKNALLNSPRFHDGCWMYTRIANPDTCRKDGEDIARLVLLKKKPPKKKAV